MSHYRCKPVTPGKGYGVVYDKEASNRARRGEDFDTDSERLIERLTYAGKRILAMNKELVELRVRVRDAEREVREARLERNKLMKLATERGI